MDSKAMQIFLQMLLINRPLLKLLFYAFFDFSIFITNDLSYEAKKNKNDKKNKANAADSNFCLAKIVVNFFHIKP